MAKKTASAELHIAEVKRGRIDVCILGTTPIVLNRMSEKAMRELLMPKGKKSAADKATSMKHDPYAEFLTSPYTDPDPKAPTLLVHLATAFKGAISAAAMDVPGSSRAQIGRLCWVEGERVALYGIPQLFMSVTRSADMNKTPDIRTRAIVPHWACRISISFVQPMLNETSIINLLVSAGLTQGTGDWRTGKGKGTYGSFIIVNENNPDFVRILKTGGRKAQELAMTNPECYDRETQELYDWFYLELDVRGKKDQVIDRASSNGTKKRGGRLAAV